MAVALNNANHSYAWAGHADRTVFALHTLAQGDGNESIDSQAHGVANAHAAALVLPHYDMYAN